MNGALVPLDALAPLLMAADAHLVTLASGFEGLVLPSKVYACIETRRPIVFVGGVRSDVHALCLDGDVPGYRRVDPGDVLGLEAALADIAAARTGESAAFPAPSRRIVPAVPAVDAVTVSACTMQAATLRRVVR